MVDEIVEKELSFQIMNAVYEVHNHLGPGFTEGIYEEALALQLHDDGMEIERQKRIKVYYKGRLIGEYLLDLVVNKKVILELKAVSEIAPIHEQQALSYLKATGLELAIVINFGTPRVNPAAWSIPKEKPLSHRTLLEFLLQPKNSLSFALFAHSRHSR